MIQPALQMAMAKKISARVTTLNSSHAPHLSQPYHQPTLIANTDLINRLAKSIAGSSLEFALALNSIE